MSNNRLEISLGNTFLGLSWLIFSFVNIIWALSVNHMLTDFNFHNEKIEMLIKTNIFAGLFTFTAMMILLIVTLAFKINGYIVSTYFSKRVQKIRLLKID